MNNFYFPRMFGVFKAPCAYEEVKFKISKTKNAADLVSKIVLYTANVYQSRVGIFCMLLQKLKKQKQNYNFVLWQDQTTLIRVYVHSTHTHTVHFYKHTIYIFFYWPPLNKNQRKKGQIVRGNLEEQNNNVLRACQTFLYSYINCTQTTFAHRTITILLIKWLHTSHIQTHTYICTQIGSNFFFWFLSIRMSGYKGIYNIWPITSSI